MPEESLGSCGVAQVPLETALSETEQELGIHLLRVVVGEPPNGARLSVRWNEHELGTYPSIALYADAFGEAEWQYYAACERALMVIQAAVNWRLLFYFDPDDEAVDVRSLIDEYTG